MATISSSAMLDQSSIYKLNIKMVTPTFFVSVEPNMFIVVTLQKVMQIIQNAINSWIWWDK